MTVNDELSIIQQTRAEVMGQKELTGENLFLAWGYPTAFFLLLEFAAIIIWGESWCDWLWIGIPLVGTPLMIHLLQKDYERTGRRTLDQNVILMMYASLLSGRPLVLATAHCGCHHRRCSHYSWSSIQKPRQKLWTLNFPLSTPYYIMSSV